MRRTPSRMYVYIYIYIYSERAESQQNRERALRINGISLGSCSLNAIKSEKERRTRAGRRTKTDDDARRAIIHHFLGGGGGGGERQTPLRLKLHLIKILRQKMCVMRAKRAPLRKRAARPCRVAYTLIPCVRELQDADKKNRFAL